MNKQILTLLAVTCACGPTPATTDTATETATDATSLQTDSDTSGEPTTATDTNATTEPATAGPTTSEDFDDCGSSSDCELYQECIDGQCVDRPDICDSGVVSQVPYYPPHVMYVIDKSTSMFAPEHHWDHDGDDLDDDGFVDDDPMAMATPKVSHWYSVHEVIALIDSAGQASTGAVLFPAAEAPVEPGPDGCILNESPEVSIAADNIDTIFAAIPPQNASDLGGGSPATQALELAYQHFDPPAAWVPKVAILLTDGVPDCSQVLPPDQYDQYDDNMLPSIEQALDDDIYTAVIGIDISSEPDAQGVVARDVLNEAAIAGGFYTNNGDEVFINARDKSKISGLFEGPDVTVDCLLELPDFPTDSTVEVYVGGQMYPQLDDQADCKTSDGFKVFEGSDPFSVDLCGEACLQFQELNTAEFLLVCPDA